MLDKNFDNTLELWSTELDNYDFEKLLLKPDAKSWSLGQLYTHLIEETGWYLEQIEGCFGNSDNNALLEMNEDAKSMLFKNEFPDKIIKGDPFISENVKQPTDKLTLQEDFNQLKLRVDHIWNKILNNSINNGKTKHPGLGYFSPREWFQYAEMHMRHHLRQKSRIDSFLKSNQ